MALPARSRTSRESDGYDDTDLRLSKTIMNYWVNFAKTGNPNGPGLPEWPAYNSKSDLNLEFSDTVHINKHLFQKECDFISRMNKIRGGKTETGKMGKI